MAAGEDFRHWQYLLGNAVSARREDICYFLLGRGLDSSEELYWLAFGREDGPARLSLLKLFHRHGVRVSQEHNDNGDTSVHAAAEYGQLEILRFLVEEMGQIELESPAGEYNGIGAILCYEPSRGWLAQNRNHSGQS